MLSSLARRAYAAFAYAAFLAASLWGVLFLADRGPLPTVDSTRTGPAWAAVLVDLGLWLVFGLHHSVLARAGVKQRLSLFWQWRALPATIWRIDAQPWVTLVWVGYGAGWVVVVASTFMIDHWEFLGLRQAGWLGSRSTSPESVARRWLYAWVRHPMMVGLLVAFWVTPVLTAGHLLFAVAASGYIAVGVHYEERDLRRHLGVAYDEYAQQVPRFMPGPGPITAAVHARRARSG